MDGGSRLSIARVGAGQRANLGEEAQPVPLPGAVTEQEDGVGVADDEGITDDRQTLREQELR